MILAIILLGIAVAMTIALGIGLILFWFFGWQYKKGNTPKVRWADEPSAGRISETEDSLYETKVQNIERKKKMKNILEKIFFPVITVVRFLIGLGEILNDPFL